MGVVWKQGDGDARSSLRGADLYDSRTGKLMTFAGTQSPASRMENNQR
jgi:hypothetical protein